MVKKEVFRGSEPKCIQEAGLALARLADCSKLVKKDNRPRSKRRCFDVVVFKRYTLEHLNKLAFTNMPGLKRLRVSSAPRDAKKSKKSPYYKSPIARILSSMSERKYLDFTQTTTDMNSTYPSGLTYGITQIAEGNDYNNRVGRGIKFSYVVVDLFCFMDTGASPNTAIPFSFHLVVDKQPNAALATYANVFDLSVITNGYAAFKNIATNEERFQILKTCYGTVDLNAHGPYRQRFYIKIPESVSVARYAGTTATYPQTNNLLIAISGSATSVGDAYFAFSTRTVFTDN